MYSLLTCTEALGVTPEQIGTKPVPSASRKWVPTLCHADAAGCKAQDFSELMQISGLSHGTDVWTGNADELIRSGTCTIAEVIGCRDSIMLYLLRNGCWNPEVL